MNTGKLKSYYSACAVLVTMLMITCPVFVFSQTDSLTTRNDADFKYRIKFDLMPDLGKLLIFIADQTTSPKEVDEIINNKIHGNREQRIFKSDKVVIDYDLKPGADANKALRNEMQVESYLKTFNTNYAKTEDPSILFDDIKVSPLKYTSYFYYNVSFTCIYKSVNAKNESFNPFNRVAEIILVNDSGWHLYINSVSFADTLNNDSLNIYAGLIKTEDDVEKIYKNIDDERQKQKKLDDAQLKNFLEEADDLADKFEFEAALKKCRDARSINPYNKDIQVKVSKIKEAQVRKKEEDRITALKLQHIADLKVLAMKEKNNYNFKSAQLICDSLINDYKINNDTINKTKDEMATILSSLIGIEAAMDKKDFKLVKKTCETKIAESVSNLYKAEFYYRLALGYKLLSPDDDKKLFENVNQAILLSDKHHQEALKLRATYYQETGAFPSAVEDATQLINNDLRNPSSYTFRAGLYEKENDEKKAIDDYGKAISYHTTNTADYISKARLEFQTGSFNECIKTTSEGIVVFDNCALLYFYRCKANDRLFLCKEAGNDYRIAIKCGLGLTEKKMINDISANYLNHGMDFYKTAAYRQAIDSYTKSILIDSNETALYMRACSYIKITMCDSALADLTALFNMNARYPLVLSKRGTAYSCLGKYTEANLDFNNGVNIYATAPDYWFEKGLSELKQKNFTYASGSFEKLIALHPSDTAYYYAALANYSNKNYDKAIEHCRNAKKQGTKNFEVYLINGRVLYDKNKFSDATGEFESAKKLIVYDDDLYFWYAMSLQGEQKFLKAAQAFNQVKESSAFYDTSLFRSGLCYIKTRDAVNYPLASEKLKQYIAKVTTEDKSEGYSWLAYSALCLNDSKSAGDFIDKGKTMNEKNPVLQFVLACNSTVNLMNDDAIKYLESALDSKQFSKDEIDDEKMLKPLRKDSRYQALIKKYFP